jgi:RNA 2',3'-cyclic 3'-phosphodiesterase
VRLFVAVNLPESTRRFAYETAAPLRKTAPSVRWVLPETLHITLKFLGDVAESRLSEMNAALAEAAAETSGFTIALRGLGAFPNFRRPRVFWIGVENAEPLVHVQSSVERVFARLGFPTEARDYHPHLTLGRTGPPLSREEVVATERTAATIEYEEMVRIDSIDLMLSRLSPDGARYEVLRPVRLV